VLLWVSILVPQIVLDAIQMQVDVILLQLFLDVILDFIKIQEIHVPNVQLEQLPVPQLHQFKHVIQDISELPHVLHVELIHFHVLMQVQLLYVKMDII